jgi:antitoxin component YwqK of YwqJK toxin-antitoxin module
MHGDYKSWYFDQEQDTTILTFQGTVKGNYLRDTVKTYFPDGRPSCVLVLQDSIQALHVVNESINESQASLALYGVRNSQSVYVSSSTDYITTAIDSSRESDRNTWNNTMYFERNLIVYCNEEGIGASQNDRLIEFSPDWDGYYKYYYKSGLLNQEGTVDKGLRSGLWKFYNEAGYVFKEVYYKSDSTIDPYENNEKLYYKGICKGFDNFGKPIYEGYIMDENFSYACATEGAISFQKLYYTKVYDSTGRDILRSDAHIPVADYQISGAKLFDGYWFNGKRDSLWKTYNAGGNPESIGFYRNGMKHGRWIQGDLSGVNYIDNACFKVEDSYAIDELRKELEFTETLFDDGKVLETHTTEVQTDGFSTSYSWYGFTKIEKIPWYWGKRRIENHSYDYYKSHSNHNILRMIARSIFGRRRYRHHDGF